MITISGIRAREEMSSKIIAVSTKPREGGGSSIQCLMLNSTNYTVWAMRMKVALKVHKFWEALNEETLEGDKNNMAIALLFQPIPEVLVLQVCELTTVKKVWKLGTWVRTSQGSKATDIDE